MASGDLIPRIYSNFRGVDFRGEDINIVRSPDSLNMWKDYKEIDSIRTRPTMEKIDISFLTNDPKPLGTWWGINCYTDKEGDRCVFLHIDDRLFMSSGLSTGDRAVKLDEGLNEAKSDSFILNERLYLKDGRNYIAIERDGWYYDVRGYIPTTSIARKPSGGGTIHEDVNMLTGIRINSFLGNGESKIYYLDAKNIDATYDVKVKVNSVELTQNEDFWVDSPKGEITFAVAPSAPLTDGQDNVLIQFCKTIPGEREKILECTLLQVFDNRVFFSGNPKYPNMVWHSSLDNPEYVSDLDYYEEGLDTSRVTGLVAGNNALWVLKEPSPANTTMFYHTPAIDSEYGKIYPSIHSNIATGCIGKAINFNDDIVFFSERGMEGIHGDVTTEQVLSHRSTLVDSRLLNEPNYKNMLLEEWKGYLLVFIDNKVYLADSRAKFTNEDHTEYEWFYWELDRKITCSRVIDGVLYLGTEDGLYKLTNSPSEIESYWTTPTDKFKYPQYMKTTNKRGCVSEVTGDVSVYVKTDKVEDFEWINSYHNVTDKIVSRIKRKKFKDIQLKFHSNTRFSLESVTLECFIGGYIKR